MNNTMIKQAGATLVSLLIGVFIGLFLVASAMKLYLHSKDTFRMRNAVSEVSESLRFSIDDMRRILMMAGREIPAVEDNDNNHKPFPPMGADGIQDGRTSTSDTVAVRFRVGPSCGKYQNVSLTTRPTMVRFYVNGQNDLVCEMTTYSGGSPKTTIRTIASNIYRLKALYGVDDDADGYANRYLSPTQINTNNLWKNIVSIRFALLAGSTTTLPTRFQPDSPGSKKILGLSVKEPDVNHLYHVAGAALAFRNLRPAIQRQ